MKVVYFAFANDPKNPLDNLTKEARAIREVLTRKNVSGDFTLTIDEFATPESINSFLDEFGDNLAIFQFSGHAGPEVLQTSLGQVFSMGLSGRLKKSADKGILKLVVLNGCSTGGQVKQLLGAGIPAVVSTNCPVKDSSALSFSTTFWKQLGDFDKDLENSFEDAIHSAQTVSREVPETASRHIVGSEEEISNEDEEVWGLHVKNDSDLKTYPLPKFSVNDPIVKIKPNKKLTETLFESFKNAGNERIKGLENAESYMKQNAIVNSFPLPIGTHLQKLICPTAGDEEGYDTFSLKRLTEICEFYQITMEFYAIVMIAQIWEIYINYPEEFSLTEESRAALLEYLGKDPESRKVYDYLSLIEILRTCMIQEENSSKLIRHFMDEQDIIGDILRTDTKFKDACNYLLYLRKMTVEQKVDEERLMHISTEAEKKLCEFVGNMGFIYRYQLTSVQSIDVWKFRHTRLENTKYRHRVVRCMEVLGTREQKYYFLDKFLDNWGMVLLKSTINEANSTYDSITGTVLDYLDLSPFVVDKNSYVEKTTLAWVMFFNGMDNEKVCFKSVRKPDAQDQYWEIPLIKDEDLEDYDLNSYHVITAQLLAFKEFLENNINSKT